MLISQIKLYVNGGVYKCQIKHDGRVVKSGRHKLAPDAYADAESRLVYKPGYVQCIPVSEYRKK